MVDIKFNLLEITLVTTYPKLSTATIPHNCTRFRQGTHCRAAPGVGKLMINIPTLIQLTTNLWSAFSRSGRSLWQCDFTRFVGDIERGQIGSDFSARKVYNKKKMTQTESCIILSTLTTISLERLMEWPRKGVYHPDNAKP